MFLFCSSDFGQAIVESPIRVQFFVTPWTAACQASPVFHYLPEFVQSHVHSVSDAI